MPFQYKPRSQATYEARAAFANSGVNGDSFDGMLCRSVSFYRPQDGENNIRILPPTWDNADHFGYESWIHYGVDGNRASYLCRQKHLGEACPVCEAHDVADAKSDVKLKRKLSPKRRVGIWLISYADVDRGPLFWFAPSSLEKKIAGKCRDRKTGEWILVDNVDNGRIVSFNKDGDGMETRYIEVSISRRPSPLHVDSVKANEWVDFVKANPIPSMLKFYPYDRIAEVFNGGVVSV